MDVKMGHVKMCRCEGVRVWSMQLRIYADVNCDDTIMYIMHLLFLEEHFAQAPLG